MSSVSLLLFRDPPPPSPKRLPSWPWPVARGGQGSLVRMTTSPFQLPLSSFIRPASCLLNLYLLFYPQNHGGFTIPIEQERSEARRSDPNAGGLLCGAKLVSHSPPPAQIVSRSKRHTSGLTLNQLPEGWGVHGFTWGGRVGATGQRIAFSR